MEFIALLKDLDAWYPTDCTIRLILDNHSAHTSMETRAGLATRPYRFKYVHTPVHGSWLNIVETLFGKMARTFLKHIRVNSREELRERILKGVAEINEAPVVHRWKAFKALEGIGGIMVNVLLKRHTIRWEGWSRPKSALHQAAHPRRGE